MKRVKGELGDPLPARAALASIVGFWCVYLIIWSVRSEILYQDHGATFVLRCLTSLCGGGLTGLYYLVLKRTGAGARRTLCAAAALGLPLAVLFAIINWMVWWYYDHNAQSSGVPGLFHDLSGPAWGVTVGGAEGVGEKAPLAVIAEKAANDYFFFVAWGALYLALRYAAQAGALERHAAELRGAAREAELRALRYQVNPHFLFNTLNSLSALVMAGRVVEAERMIARISTFFRTSLSGDPTEDVELGEEIRLQQLYLEIEMVRFPDRLRFAIDIPDPLSTAAVPGLILQPLVENAVKHGVACSREIVTIAISARDLTGVLELTVSDNAAVPSLPVDGAGVGLRNVADRLSARYGEAGSITAQAQAGGGFVATLRLPRTRRGR